MKALLSQCMKYMPVACMKSLMLAHEGWEFDSPAARQIPICRAEREASPKMLLIVLLLAKSLAHACSPPVRMQK